MHRVSTYPAAPLYTAQHSMTTPGVDHSNASITTRFDYTDAISILLLIATASSSARFKWIHSSRVSTDFVVSKESADEHVIYPPHI
jgi:hypothetical protein